MKGAFPYTGPLDCFRKIVKADGVHGLYRGLPPTLVGIVPEKAIKLAMNDFLREKFEDESTGEIKWYEEIIAAAGAGATQVIATNPMEIVKIRMQTQHNLPVQERLNGLQIARSLGFKGMYYGTKSTLMRDVPYGVIFFPTYANLKLWAAREDGTNSILSIIASGAAAGAIAAACVTPSDVIKTRLQMKGAKYKGIVDCYQHIVKSEGHAALIKGMGPRMMVQAPLFGITLVAFELQKQYMS